jgi:hypothetical protein
MRDDDDPVLTRRRRRKERAFRRRVLLLTGAGAFFLIAAAVWWLSRGGLSESASDDWSFADLHAHLGKNGYRCTMYPADGGGVWYITGKNDDEIENTFNWVSQARGVTSPDAIRCVKLATRQHAYEAAGRTPGRSFSWGRFEFLGQPSPDGVKNLGRLHRALTGRPFKP